MRLFIIANLEKPEVRPALEQLTPWLAARLKLVGVDSGGGTDLTRLEADAILVLGGDGTLLSAARRLGGRQIPLVGINFGRLGFLASFTLEQFYEYFDRFEAGKLAVSARLVLEASVVSADQHVRTHDAQDIAAKRNFVATALNDAVITAGPPFRMIELELGADGGTLIRYFGDGVIVATPSGSTAYNVSAGGPIISPAVDALCITPLCPHSLSFRPVVVPANMVVTIVATRVNAGTTLFCDGQASVQLKKGDRIVIRRSPNDVLLIENPDAREWRTLAEKLHWAVSPRHRVGEDVRDDTE